MNAIARILPALVFATGVPAFAQEGAVLSGRVFDRTTGQPLGRAQVILSADSRTVDADSLGRFRLSKMPLGASQVMIRAIGFPVQMISVRFDAFDEQFLNVLMDSTPGGLAQALPSIDVSAAAPAVSYRLTSFERRRKTGRGQYLTENDITKMGAYNVPDAVKHMRGIIYECAGNGCSVRMSRAPMRCLPQYIVDDQVMNDFGPATPIRDVVGIEVYMGPADVPGEYAGSNAMCGVIVIHTRAGPRLPPRRPG